MIDRAQRPVPAAEDAEAGAACADGGSAAGGSERDAAVSALAARRLGFWQLALLLASGGCGVLGWACAALTVESFEQGGLGAVTGLVLGVLALLSFVLAALGVAVWTRRGQDAQDALDDWAYPLPLPYEDETHGTDLPQVGADPGGGGGPGVGAPPTDPRAVGLVERRWRSGAWLALAGALCVFGVWKIALTGAEGASAALTALLYSFGLGLSALVTGVLAAVRAAGHMRWSAGWLGPGAGPRRGGAHR